MTNMRKTKKSERGQILFHSTVVRGERLVSAANTKEKRNDGVKGWHSRNELYPVLCYYVSKSLFINVLILRMIYLGMFSMCSP